MKTATQAATKTQTAAAPVAAQAETMEQTVAREAKEYTVICHTAREAGRNVKFQVLLLLAAALGESANKLGRPSEETHHAFITAMVGRKLSYEQRAQLARTANKHHAEKMAEAKAEKYKPVAIVTGKAGTSEGVQKFRFNIPAMTEEALG